MTPEQINALPPDKRRELFAAARSAVAAAEQDRPDRHLDAELAACLGAPYHVGGLTFSPPTLGVFAVLEFLGNGVTGDAPGECSLFELWEFFFLLHAGESVLPAMYDYARAKRAIDRTGDIAGQGPEYYREYLQALVALETDLVAGWHDKVESFAQGLDGVPPEQLLDLSQQIVRDAFAAFGDMAPDARAKKKPLSETTGSGFNRALKIVQWLHGALAFIRSDGKSRLQN